MSLTRLSTRSLAVAVAALLFAAPASALAKSYLFGGSTSVTPLAQLLLSKYKSVSHGRFSGRVAEQGGSNIGVNDVSTGALDVGMSSRDPLSSDPAGLVFNKVARDGICVITNQRNPVGQLSASQIQQIFTGQIRSWDALKGAGVGGVGVSGPIDLLSRTAASGTADAFKAIFLNNTLNVSSSAAQKDSNGLVQAGVRSDPNAIGFVSFAFTTGVNPVGYQGVACNLRNAKSGQYQGVRNFWFVTRGKATGPTKSFITWAQHNSTAQRIVASSWVAIH